MHVEVAIPVPLKMYQRLHEGPLADDGESRSDKLPRPRTISSFIRLLFSKKLQ